MDELGTHARRLNVPIAQVFTNIRGLAGAAIFAKHDRRAVVLAWLPWVILSVFVFIWGIPDIKKALDGISVVKIPFEGLHNMIEKIPPDLSRYLICPMPGLLVSLNVDTG